jgi:hypothetical protein
MIVSTSTPSLSSFNPKIIPYQFKVIKHVRTENYNENGVQEFLLSGAVGSAKSILMAHIGVTHCLLFRGARCMVGRQSMPDLKDTLIQKIIEHISPDLKEGRDYEYNRSSHKFTFDNYSEIVSRSWADKNFTRFRSLELSCALIEELTESDGEYWGFYEEVFARIGRLSHVPERFLMSATNPDSPRHPAYKRLIATKNPNRHVYYSITKDNPFLPATYTEQLKENFDTKTAMRMLEGKWVELDFERIYYNYDSVNNFKDEHYEFDMDLPVDIMFDFNIAAGKPMSACVGQYDSDGVFHAARTYVVQGARTDDILQEIAADNIFEIPEVEFRVFGDASGKHQDTRSKVSDYDIIEKFLANYVTEDKNFLKFRMRVPPSNPPIRKRHNLVNGIMRNANGRTRCFVYKDALKLDEGLRLTKLKDGGSYIEDDTDDFQHVTTAFGYWVVYILDGHADQRVTVRQRG